MGIQGVRLQIKVTFRDKSGGYIRSIYAPSARGTVFSECGIVCRRCMDAIATVVDIIEKSEALNPKIAPNGSRIRVPVLKYIQAYIYGNAPKILGSRAKSLAK